MDRLLKLAAVRRLTASGRAKEIRLRARLSLDEIGLAIDRTAATVSRWEAGAARPHGDAAVAYFDLLWALEQDLAGTTVLGTLPSTQERRATRRVRTSAAATASPPEAA